MNRFVLFLKENLAFMVFQLLLILFILVLFFLDGMRNFNTAIYTICISMLLTMGFLAAKFIMRRTFYAAITKKPTKMEDALIKYVQSPENKVTTAFTRDLYKLYQNEVQSLYTAQHRQLYFMNQWVHQMKTPISVINLLLQEEGELDRASISEEVSKLQHGLDSVLVTARLETFEDDMQIERVNLKELIQGVLTEHKRLFITNGVFPVLSMNDEMTIATDLKWIKVVISQFITNAVKYTFDEGKKVHVIAEKNVDGIKLLIKDEGVGIPSSDMKRLTKAFFTGENGRLTGESTGMGLYIASEVCGKLGHPLTITSEQGVGTTVGILFKYGEVGKYDDDQTDSGIDRSDEDL